MIEVGPTPSSLCPVSPHAVSIPHAPLLPYFYSPASPIVSLASHTTTK